MKASQRYLLRQQIINQKTLFAMFSKTTRQIQPSSGRLTQRKPIYLPSTFR